MKNKCIFRLFLISDNGHSFDAVLFFGNELTLLTFDILVFSIIDLASGNFVLAGVLTYGISAVSIMYFLLMA